VNPPSVSALNADVLEGSALDTVVLSGTVSGDVNSLSGRTVYVIVEDPAALFEPTATLQLQQAGSVWQYTLTLRGRALGTSGRRTGNVRVFVCLDAACNSRLNGTPIAIPFNVNVMPGMVLSTQTIQVTVPFGTVPPEQAVDVALSPFSTAWVSSDATPFNPALTKTLVLVDGNQWNPGPQVRFRLTPAIPGTYTERVRVHTTATIGPNLSRDFDQFIDVTYTVTPNDAIDHVFDPPSLNITHSASNPLMQEHRYQLYTNFGTTQVWRGVVYDPAPSTANGTSFLWWNDNLRQSSVCLAYVVSGGGFTYDCLPPGVYTAKVQYELFGPSGSRIVEFPITMTVTP
jgi:hypothetical protein